MRRPETVSAPSRPFKSVIISSLHNKEELAFGGVVFAVFLLPVFKARGGSLLAVPGECEA